MENTNQNNISDINQSTINDDYETKMLDAFIQKPEKLFWYKNAFAKYNVNGIDKMAWHWSWWAFFGDFWFLLYRKAYLAALVVFILDILVSFIPFVGPLIFAILRGGYSTFFIYKKYIKLKQDIENLIPNENERIETMRQVGGPNKWVIWLNILFVGLVVIGIISAIAIPNLTTN
jgi:hypothetical protein